MGLIRAMKDLRGLTRQVKEMQAHDSQVAGLGGMLENMGTMLSETNQQLADLVAQTTERARILAEGIPGDGVIIAMGTPAREAQQYNLDLDLEIRIDGREPYRVANSYVVPAAAQLHPGVVLPISVDRDDPAKIAIDWHTVPLAPARGEVRPAPDARAAPAPASSTGTNSRLDELERLARLRESGALTEDEFAQEKARLLGS